MLRGKRVLVTGGKGFVGSHLVQRLEKDGAAVITLDISSGQDITDWKQVKDYNAIDIIYHLAAKTYIPSSFEGPGDTYLSNLNGTINMLELARKNKPEKFIFASSYIYGTPEYLPVDEKHPIRPANPYSRSKAIGEELCRAYYEDYGLKCVIIRAFNIYGEGQNNSFLIPSILKQIDSGEIKLDNPVPKRDFLYVEDAVEAYIRAAEYHSSDFDVFNIGSGVSYSVAEIVAIIIAISGQNIKARYRHKERKNEVMDTVADIAKAKEKLGWQPKTGIDQGLKRTMQSSSH